MTDNADSGIFKRNLAVKLTEAEFVEMATELATVDEAIDEQEVAKKAAAEEFKDAIGGMRSRKAKLRKIVKDKIHYKDIDCQWVADWASKSMILRRLDSQEAIDVRAMTDEELQVTIDSRVDDPTDISADVTPEGKQLAADTNAGDIDTDGSKQ